MSNTARYSLNKNKYLLDPEHERLIHLLKSHINKDTRNCVLLFMALHTGARAQELLNIKTSDINHSERSVLIYGIKGSNDREIPLPDWLYKEVDSLVKSNSKNIKSMSSTDDNFLFSISYPRLVQIWLLYRPVHKSFHSLRHTFAIRLYKKTKDIRLVQVALGHRNITNTMIYADYVYSQEELRKLITN